jgi:hypothetical protein
MSDTNRSTTALIPSSDAYEQSARTFCEHAGEPWVQAFWPDLAEDVVGALAFPLCRMPQARSLQVLIAESVSAGVPAKARLAIWCSWAWLLIERSAASARSCHRDALVSAIALAPSAHAGDAAARSEADGLLVRLEDQDLAVPEVLVACDLGYTATGGASYATKAWAWAITSNILGAIAARVAPAELDEVIGECAAIAHANLFGGR